MKIINSDYSVWTFSSPIGIGITVFF